MANEYKKLGELAAAGDAAGLKTLAEDSADPELSKRARRTAANLEKTAKTKGTVTKQAKSIMGQMAEGALLISDFNAALSKQNATYMTNNEALSKNLNFLVKYNAHNIQLAETIESLIKKQGILTKTLGIAVKKGFEKSAGALLDTTVIWSKFGITADKSAGIMNDWTTTMGMSTSEIKKTGRAVMDFATKAGLPVRQVMEQMGDAVKEFHDNLNSEYAVRQGLIFTARAKAMGTDVKSLMGTLKSFEDIDTAQKTGAQLNATLTALGGSFDAVKAASMDYPDRMEYIARSIQSVAPRIKASSPVVQRKYMQALAKAMPGGSVGMIRKFMTFKPSDMIDAERDLTAGVLGAVSAGQERQMAHRAVSARTVFGQAQKRGGMFTGEGVALAAGATLGVDQTTTVRDVQELLGSGLQTVISNLAKELEEREPEIMTAASEAMDRHFGSAASGIGKLKKEVEKFTENMIKRNAQLSETMIKHHGEKVVTCWVAEVLYGKNHLKTHHARYYARTNNNWFIKLYTKYGRTWADLLEKNMWAAPIVQPIWDWMANRGNLLIVDKRSNLATKGA